MAEVIRHIFGLCGDNHPSIMTLLGGSTIVVGIKAYWKYFISSLKTLLKR